MCNLLYTECDAETACCSVDSSDSEAVSAQLGHASGAVRCFQRSPTYSQCRRDCPWSWECAKQKAPVSIDHFELPSSASELRERWQRMADEDPRLNSLVHLLQGMGIFLLLIAVAFCRIRCKAAARRGAHPLSQNESIASVGEPPAPPKTSSAKRKLSKALTKPKSKPGHSTRVASRSRVP
mmetsp:Transcript_65554/g.108894  ORF Transcript_65554/g.108894 Transcript_65554/m.108894 type:complete len:181 (+) Transcript_65554:132-674(+)